MTCQNVDRLISARCAVVRLNEALDMKKAADALTVATGVNQCRRTVDRNLIPPPLPPEYQTVDNTVVHGGAPPVVESPQPGCSSFGTEPGSLSQLQIGPARRRKQESAGWLSSILLHAVLIGIIGLILAPADYGGADALTLIMTFNDQAAAEEVEVPQVEVSLAVNETTSDETDAAPPLPNPAPMAARSGAASSNPAEQAGGNAPSGNASPRGSFFGINAHGHEFVYVLDMSGSMEGRRFRRATTELERSVSELHPSQKFYVILFDDVAVQMFNGTGVLPKSVPATTENKEKLSHWLSTAYRGGGTDPREALRIALRMNPSAIFMLSDGKFNGKKKKKTSLVRGNSDAFSIVEAAAASVPIHAIAFENATSCENMQRLAEMTNGAYRFCKPQDEQGAQASLARARAVRDLGDIDTATRLLRDIIASFDDTDAAWTARRELSATLFDVADTALARGQLDEVKKALLEMVSIDTLAVISTDVQDDLVNKLLECSQQSAGSQAEQARSILAEIVDRYPKSRATLQIIGPVADQLTNQALILAASDHPVQSVIKMEEVLTKYPQTVAAERCRLEQKRMVENLLAHARELRQTDDDAASAKYLNDLVVRLEGTGAEAITVNALEDLAIEMLTKARDGTVGRDHATREDAEQQLSDGFAGNEILQRVQREFDRNERKARELLRQGVRREKIGELNTAQQLYNRIIDEYPATLAAKKAQANLRAIQREQSGDRQPLQQDLELLEMMRS